MAGRKQRRSDKTRLTAQNKREAKSTNQWLADRPRDSVGKDELRRLAAEAVNSGVSITRVESGKRPAKRAEAGWPDSNRSAGIRKVFKAPKV